MSTRIQIQPIGVLLGWGSVAMLAVGVAKFSGSFLLLGLLGGVGLWFARKLGVRNLSGSSMTLVRMWPDQGFSGESFRGGLRIQSGEFPRREIEVIDQMPALEADSVRFSEIDGTQEQWSDCRIRGRGIVLSGNALVRSSFPLGLWQFERSLAFESSSEMILLPRPMLPSEVERELERTLADGLAIEHSVAAQGVGSGEIRGVRPYASGDRVRSIHWPASSRGQGMMVREFERPMSQARRFGLVVHGYVGPGEILRPDQFERALRIACGVICWCREHQMDVETVLLLEAPDGEVLTRLALASRRDVSRGKLTENIATLEAGCDRVIVVGETPLEMSSQMETLFVDPAK